MSNVLTIINQAFLEPFETEIMLGNDNHVLSDKPVI